ncbi:MAG TPA: PKD domain-containing protein [Pyrinomonadaceae bacterium]
MITPSRRTQTTPDNLSTSALIRRWAARRKNAAGRAASRLRGCLPRAFSILMTLCLLTTSTPAAPQVAAQVATGFAADVNFWRISGAATELLSRLRGRPAVAQKGQAERDALVARITISPGDVTIRTGERMMFAALAYTRDDVPVGGVRFEWRAQDLARGRGKQVKRSGEFVSQVPGKFRVTAEGAGSRAQVLVTVVGDDGRTEPRGGKFPKRDEKPLKVEKYSTRDVPAEESSSRPSKRRDARADKGGARRRDRSGAGLVAASYAHAAAPAVAPTYFIQTDWDSTNYTTADSPRNRRGDPTERAEDGGAGSGNFQLGAPVTNMPGRGLSIQLKLAYNAHVWNKSGSEVSYDLDRDWPAPGWSLGFGKLIKVDNRSMLIDSDNTRHSWTGTVNTYSWGQTFNGRTTDGTFIDYTHNATTAGVITTGMASYPNGTVINFAAPGNNAVYPTRITDPNGNYITITYRNNSGPQIESVTDSMGRPILFHYDASGQLTAISQPSDIFGNSRTLVRLHYRTLTLDATFSGLTAKIRSNPVKVIDALYYPSTCTGYWFGDADSYSSYGMIAKVQEQRAMTLTAASLNDQGTITPGAVLNQKVYNFPLTSAYIGDVPTYTTLTETWAVSDVPSAVTNYDVQQSANPRVTTITQPDGTRNVQYSYNAPNHFTDGLVYQDDTFDPAGKLLRRSQATWEQGDYESVRPVRNTVTDENGQTTVEEFVYAAKYNQVVMVNTYDYGGTRLKRSTITEYNNDPAYINRHIFSLVKSATVYPGDSVFPVSRAEYQYDGAGSTLQATPGVIMHDQAFDPYDPQYLAENCYTVCDPYDPYCWEECYEYYTSDYNPATDYRGNLTRVTEYIDPANNAGPVVMTKKYDVTGNLVAVSNSCCDETRFTYGSDTYYAYPSAQSSGSADPNSSVRITTSSTYDFYSGLTLSTTDANGRVTQIAYDAAFRPITKTLPTGGSVTYFYDDNNGASSETYKLADGTVTYRNGKAFDGEGRIKTEYSLGVGGYDVVETLYDASGRAFKQSLPYRAGQPKYWNETFYDALDRPTKVVESDGSTEQSFYNETARPPGASTEPGETVRTVDAWGRERWQRTDSSGRLVEVVEPNPSGNGSVFAAGALITRYYYDTLGRLKETAQGGQRRRFRHDPLGRLTHQKLPEASPTLNDAGQYVGAAAGQWSQVYIYDDRSNLVSKIDARGVRTVFNYNNDPLNRLQSVAYDTSGFGDTANPIVAAPSVTYQYVTSGDLSRLSRMTVQGVSTQDYGYNTEGHPSSVTLTHASRPSHPMTVEYVYDTQNRLTDIRYPTQYGTSTPRKLVHSDFDAGGRLSGLKVAGADYASQMTYDTDSRVTSLLVGPAGVNQITETNGFDPRNGMLTSQKVTRGTATLLNLGYDYAGGPSLWRTGQIKKITNHLNAAKNRIFDYDALGRLVKATNGSTWAERYAYDRYGNRLTVSASANVATYAPARQFAPLAEVAEARDLRQDGGGLSVSDSPPFSPLADTRAPEVAAPRLVVAGDARREAAARDAAAAPQAAPQQTPTPSPTPAKTMQVDQSPTVVSPIICPDTDPDCQQNMQPTAVPGGPYTGQSGVAIQFNGSDSYDDDGYITSYSWTFGDGSTATGATPSHVYAAPGNYTATLRVRDNAFTYSTIVSTAVTVTNPSANGATFISHDVPTTMNAGLKYTVSVTMKNTGTKTWTAADLHRLGPQNPQDNNTWGVTRVNVPMTVAPHGSAVFTFVVTAPSAPGAYNFQWRMLQDAVEWFGDFTPNVVVNVAAAATGSCTGTVPCDGLATLSYDTGTNHVNSAGWLYDAAGNQVRTQSVGGSWQRYQYDVAGRLAKVKTDAGTTINTYTYNANNQRLVTQEGSETSNVRTYYVWDGEKVITEYRESGTTTPSWVKNYIYLGGRLLATQQPGSVAGTEAVAFHHPDHLGTRLVTDPANGTQYEQSTLPFGTGFSAETTGNTNRRFTSYDRNQSTGLDYAVNRHYDPAQGRFTQPDPLGVRASNLSDPQTLNLYSYCGNDPINREDADGLLFGKLFKGIAKAIGSVVKGAGKLLKAIGKGVSAVATVMGKILHNRWVMLAVGIMSFLFPPIALIYQTFSDIASALKLVGLVLEQRWKELGMALVWAAAEFVATRIVNWGMEKLQKMFLNIQIVPLSSCMKHVLSQVAPDAIPLLDGIRLHMGQKKGSGGLTWGNDIAIFGMKWEDRGNLMWGGGLTLLRHEVRHVQANNRPGGRYRFGIQYLGGMFVAMFRGGQPLGEKNPMEAPHYAEMDELGVKQVTQVFKLAVAAGTCP